MKKLIGICLVLCLILCGCHMVRPIMEQGILEEDSVVIENSLPAEQTNEVEEEDSWSIEAEDSLGESVEEEVQQENFDDTFEEVIYTGSLDVYSISQETFIRSGEKMGDLSELGEDEYYSLVMHLQYNGEGTLSWSEACVTVDGGEPWHWNAGSLDSGKSTSFHIYYVNMQKLSEGSHNVSWFMDGVEVYSDTFMITRNLNWEQLTELPSEEEIAAYTNPTNLRSPYMSVWLSVPSNTRYTEYAIEFKSDHFPLGSYYAIGNWKMDYSSLEQQYAEVKTEYGISAYAGFQNIYNGDKIAIMSFWDVYCTDANGTVTTIRPEVTYPVDPYQSGEFGGEGTGAQCLVPYEWEENHWYRAHLRCVESDTTGTTQVEFWVCDLETDEYTLLCAYDTGVMDSAFKGNIAIFLENYLKEHAGEIRTMEVRNARYLDEADGVWHAIVDGNMYPNSGALSSSYAGSYDYGVEGDRLWIMTTGVGDNWDDGAGQYLYWGE